MKRNSIALILFVLLLLTGCSSLGRVHTVAVLGKADTDEAVIVGTSAVTGTELDSIVNQYSGIFNNPFLAWGRYRKGWLKTTLPISFQFHHAQMDGSHAARFLEELQKAINSIE